MLGPPNAQTGTTYTFVAADTTRVVTFNNASPVAVTLPNGATAGFGGGTMLSVVNLGAGQVTITCSSCTITANGVAAATLPLSQGQGADIYGGYGSPAVNYIALPSPAGGGPFSVSNLTVSGTGTFNGTLNSMAGGSLVETNINNTMYVSQFAGADLGAKMNAAVATCTATFTACKYIIDIGGTISTAPNFPLGSSVECTATSPITLATTWAIMHASTVYDFKACQFNYNQDSSSDAFLLGKNSTGVVNTAGTAITYVSGTNFANMDVGDAIAINGSVFNVCGVSPPNSLTTCATAGTQTGVAYGAHLGIQNVGSSHYSVTIKDLSVNYTGAATTTSIGFHAVKANAFDLVRPHITGFNGGQSVGLQLNGVDSALIDHLSLLSNKCQIILDQSVTGGETVSTNLNKFVFPLITAGGACSSGLAVNIENNAFGNEFDTPDAEGNVSTTVFGTQTGAYKTIIRDGDFEVNGDGTGSSVDISFTGASIGNLVENNEFTSLAVNHPAEGIICSGAGVFCSLRNNVWGPANNAYTTAWNFVGGAQGIIIGNNPGSSAHGDPVNSQDTSGNYTLSTVVASRAIIVSGTACTNGELLLSAGWQSTGSATVTGVKGNGQTCEWTITTGTTTAANPTVTDTLTNTLTNPTTVCEMIITGGNRTAAAGDGFDQTTLSATAPVFTFQGTPTAGGKTYQVLRRCGP